MIKNMVFLDKEVKPKIKLDLWNAAVNSIMKYSMATIQKTQAPGANAEIRIGISKAGYNRSTKNIERRKITTL